jgi:hypothetical protein
VHSTSLLPADAPTRGRDGTGNGTGYAIGNCPANRDDVLAAESGGTETDSRARYCGWRDSMPWRERCRRRRCGPGSRATANEACWRSMKHSPWCDRRLPDPVVSGTGETTHTEPGCDRDGPQVSPEGNLQVCGCRICRCERRSRPPATPPPGHDPGPPKAVMRPSRPPPRPHRERSSTASSSPLQRQIRRAHICRFRLRRNLAPAGIVRVDHRRWRAAQAAPTRVPAPNRAPSRLPGRIRERSREHS